MDKFLALLRMIKIEHSVFALPFAYIGAFLAAGGWPGVGTFTMLTIAMVAMRSFAMAFNRLADLKFDSLNPRTQSRPLVSGEISVKSCIIFLNGTAIVFLLACWGLNDLCLTLAPIPLIIGALYSFTKRYTPLCHWWLGAVLGLSPLAGWLAVDPTFTVPAALFFCGVTFWVAGFDILYSCQDVDFDREQGLHSAPADFGIPTALTLSSFSHVQTVLFFGLAGWAAHLSWAYFLVWAVVSAILIWEHTLIKADDMSRVNLAFFTANGIIAVAVFVGVLAGIYV